MRESGKICCSCKVLLEPPPARKRYCPKCQPKRHRVYMHFMLLPKGWVCHFLEADVRTSLSKKLIFQDPQKIVEMAKKGGADFMSADRLALEYGINLGRRSLWLNLTDEQYKKLK